MREKCMNNFYVYGHFTKDTHDLFYVGKGKENRAYEFNVARTKWWRNVVNKHGITVKLLHENLTEEQALFLEKQLIKQHGRRDLSTGSLVNLTDGGEGSSGRVVSVEARNKMSLAKKGKKYTEEHKKKMSDAHKNVSEESKKKMSIVKMGKKRKPFSEEHKRKIAQSQKKRHAANHLVKFN
jgi:hypothetical protein